MKNSALQNQINRLNSVKKWAERISALSAAGMTAASFCRKHDIQQAQLARYKNLASLPRQDVLERIEAAFEKEGV